MHDTLRFWLRRGVDGFRIDVMGMIVKHPELADNPPNPHWRPGSLDPKYLWSSNRNHPDVYEAVRGIRAVLDEFPGSMAVGEVFGSAEEISRYYGRPGELDGLHLAFNFQFIHEIGPVFTPWTSVAMRRIAGDAEEATPRGALPCWAFGNHDRSRFISRHNDDGFGPERARAAAILLLCLRGVPFIYYGEEIGMTDVDIPEERLQDPARFRTPGRDPERTPMQWDGSSTRGFSSAEPWLPYGPAGRPRFDAFAVPASYPGASRVPGVGAGVIAHPAFARRCVRLRTVAHRPCGPGGLRQHGVWGAGGAA